MHLHITANNCSLYYFYKYSLTIKNINVGNMTGVSTYKRVMLKPVSYKPTVTISTIQRNDLIQHN